MEKVIVFGASGHANVIIDILEKQKKYQVLGIFVDTSGMINTKVMGYPVLGNISEFYGSTKGVIAIGDNFGRKLVAKKIKEINPDFQFITAIHPSAIIGKNVEIGEGTVVVGGAIINPNTNIGEHCIINTKSAIDHDVRVGNFSTVAPGVTIGGNVVIGALSTISMGVNIIQKINIGNCTLIGAGSTVIKDIPDGVLAYGLPAKVIRKREIDEKYV
ncbi:acetyltransferase [Neobacillus sp. NPDC093127]|uniref:acetyltransferase n=1 Tax=Neobacillus sp. NPDC093127 TaxID=3364296 RepID=UPI0037F4F3D1